MFSEQCLVNRKQQQRTLFTTVALPVYSLPLPPPRSQSQGSRSPQPPTRAAATAIPTRSLPAARVSPWLSHSVALGPSTHRSEAAAEASVAVQAWPVRTSVSLFASTCFIQGKGAEPARRRSRSHVADELGGGQDVRIRRSLFRSVFFVLLSRAVFCGSVFFFGFGLLLLEVVVILSWSLGRVLELRP
jgi:hypothetical protein